ncbi:MAG: hypothetical protein IPN38_16790 [Flavobacteriales bacterium]|nr:hypothetical protein [Flavobacteriales bacterium]
MSGSKGNDHVSTWTDWSVGVRLICTGVNTSYTLEYTTGDQQPNGVWSRST